MKQGESVELTYTDFDTGKRETYEGIVNDTDPLKIYVSALGEIVEVTDDGRVREGSPVARTAVYGDDAEVEVK